MKRSGTLTFGLFVIVVLGAVYLLLQRSGRASLGLVALFVINLRQQRHNAERGKGSVKIETKLQLNDEDEGETEPPSEPPAASRP
jgi:hypothetical protein